MDFRLLLFFAGLVLMLGVETMFPARAWRTPRQDRILKHGALALGNALVVRLVVTAPFLAWAAYVSDKEWGLAPRLGLAPVAGIAATIVVFDYFDYWKHRWYHRFPLMWRFHQVHHSDTHLDLTTATRYHLGELLISAAIKAGWILVWGPTAIAFAASEVALNMASQFHHANIELGERWDRRLRRLIVTPRYHAGHHSVNKRDGDYDFATILTVWDRLHGTFVAPRVDEIDLEGLRPERASYLDFKEILLEPLSDLRKRALYPPVASIEPEAAAALMRRGHAVLLDVREQRELADGMAAGAYWFPFSRVARGRPDWTRLVVDEWSKKTVIVYCARGTRAAKVCRLLIEQGLEAVNMGGFSGWRAASLPEEHRAATGQPQFV